MRSFTIALATTASLMLGGVAIAQSSDSNTEMNKTAPGMSGDTSGTAAGGNVTPSTSVQKNHRSSSSDNNGMAPAGGGAPGIEGPAGSENGPAPSKDMK